MEGRKLNLDGGRIRIEMELDPEEYTKIVDAIAKLNNAAVEDGDNKHCCRCSDGSKKTVSGDPIGAFFECLGKCGPAFSLSGGHCPA